MTQFLFTDLLWSIFINSLCYFAIKKERKKKDRQNKILNVHSGFQATL